MPKLIDYPRASLKTCLEIAKTVESLGGKCSLESAAQKLGKKVTGTFKSAVGATGKFGLVVSSGGNLTVTPVQKSLKLAYNEEEKTEILRKAFLSPTVFRDLAQKFNGIELPVDMLGKLLAREFGVEAAVATTVANYFIEGAKFVGILDGKGIINIDGNGGAKDVESKDEPIEVEQFVDEPRSMPTTPTAVDRQRAFASSPDTTYELVDSDKRTIQIPLPNKRMAELTIPADMTAKDLFIIQKQIEVLAAFVENS